MCPMFLNITRTALYTNMFDLPVSSNLLLARIIFFMIIISHVITCNSHVCNLLPKVYNFQTCVF